MSNNKFGIFGKCFPRFINKYIDLNISTLFISIQLYFNTLNILFIEESFFYGDKLLDPNINNSVKLF